VGFFSSLFGLKTSPAPRASAAAPVVVVDDAPPRGRAASGPLPGQDGAAVQTAAARELDVPAMLTEARDYLDRQDLPPALLLYEQIAQSAPALASAMTTISGDLGATGHIEALIEFVAPRYEPMAHGVTAGINLLQAFLHQRNVGAAQQLHDVMRHFSAPGLRARLDGFQTAITKMRGEIAAEAPAAPAGAPEANVQLINISKPIWAYGLQQEGDTVLPTKAGRTRCIGFLPIALSGEGVADNTLVPASHPLASLVRGLPLALAEACWFVPTYRPVAVCGIDPQKSLLILPRAFGGEQARQLFPQEVEPLDFAVAGAVQAAADGTLRAVEFTLWEVRKARLMKTFSAEGPAAVAKAWSQLLGYLEATKPVNSLMPYAAPADPAAHAVVLDQVLHFFLAEKKVLPLERLAPHAPRLAALATYAQAHPEATVPRLTFFSALHHCQAMGLAVPPELVAAAEKLSAG
jgi:hypothetical protein